MPTYEYECTKGHHHEIYQSITAEALTRCPTCQGKMARLLGSGAGFLFKGSGFYITDYRSKSYNDAKKRDEQSSSSSSSSCGGNPASCTKPDCASSDS